MTQRVLQYRLTALRDCLNTCPTLELKHELLFFRRRVQPDGEHGLGFCRERVDAGKCCAGSSPPRMTFVCALCALCARTFSAFGARRLRDHIRTCETISLLSSLLFPLTSPVHSSHTLPPSSTDLTPSRHFTYSCMHSSAHTHTHTHAHVQEFHGT